MSSASKPSPGGPGHAPGAGQQFHPVWYAHAPPVGFSPQALVFVRKWLRHPQHGEMTCPSDKVLAMVRLSVAYRPGATPPLQGLVSRGRAGRVHF